MRYPSCAVFTHRDRLLARGMSTEKKPHGREKAYIKEESKNEELRQKSVVLHMASFLLVRLFIALILRHS